MTPKEKAEELVYKYREFDFVVINSNKHIEQSKKCALIAVDELIYETSFEVPNIRQRYWQDVKQEIEKL